MPAPLLALQPVEPDLSPDRVDQRLAAGWFPFGQAWMTCRAWPDDEGLPHDTVWVRVRTVPVPRRPSDRQRRLWREGASASLLPHPVFDDEHQALYERFRAELHPDWETEQVSELLVWSSQQPGPLLASTRELAVRDAQGRLLAFRWLVLGRSSIAGVSAIYEPRLDGLGTLARALADRWAGEQGLGWTYPGYVRPGSPDPWHYKIKVGRTEYLDPERGRWLPWVGEGPAPQDLCLAEMRRRLARVGEVHLNASWAAACFHPASRGLVVPYFVPGVADGRSTAVVWDLAARRYEVLFLEGRG